MPPAELSARALVDPRSPRHPPAFAEHLSAVPQAACSGRCRTAHVLRRTALLQTAVPPLPGNRRWSCPDPVFALTETSRATHHPSRPTEPGVVAVVAAPGGAGPLAGRADRRRPVPGGGGPRPLVRGAAGGRRVRQGAVPQ